MRRDGAARIILALLALLWLPVGCGDGGEEDLADQWGRFLAGSWRLASLSSLDLSISCPGEIEIDDGVFLGCGEVMIVFRSNGTFREDGFRDEWYSRQEGIWRLARNELTLEATESGTSSEGPVQDADMQRLEPAEISVYAVRISGVSLRMTEIGPSAPFTLVLRRT